MDALAQFGEILRKHLKPLEGTDGYDAMLKRLQHFEGKMRGLDCDDEHASEVARTAFTDSSCNTTPAG